MLASLTLGRAILHDDSLSLSARLVMVSGILLPFPASLRVLSIQCPVMEDNRTRNRYIQRSRLIRVLWNVDKVIAHGDLIFIQATAFIAQHESGVATEGQLMDGARPGQDFDAANRNGVVCAVLTHTLCRREESHIHLCCCSLRPECRYFVLLSGRLDKKDFT